MLNASVFIETGTYYGQTTAYAAKNFKRVYSIELSEYLAKGNREDFSAYTNVTIVQGDSGRMLGSIAKNVDGAAVYWLDGHYSGGITAEGNEVCPILNEIKQIAENSRGLPFAIIIDDRRLFDGTGGYPTIGRLTSEIKTLWPVGFVGHDQDAIILMYRPTP